MEIKVKKNFNLEKLIRGVKTASSVLLNDLAKPIKEDWDARIHRSVPPGLEKTTTDLHGSHIPLNLTGKLAKSNKIIRANPKKLKATVKNTAKSTTSYKIRKPNGKIYRGKRKSAPVFYGYWLNKGFTTSSKSLIPNAKVPARNFSSLDIDVFGRSAAYKVALDKFFKNLKLSAKMASR